MPIGSFSSWNIIVIRHHPHPTTKENLFTLVYVEDIMLPVEIDTPLWRHSKFNQELNHARLEYAADLVDELKEIVYIREFSTKHRALRRHNSKVVPRELWDEDLVFKQAVLPTQPGKL